MGRDVETPFLAVARGEQPAKHKVKRLLSDACRRLWSSAALLISLAALVCSTIPLFVKQLHGHVDAIEVVLGASIISWCLTSIWLLGSGEELQCLWSGHVNLLMLRGLLGAAVTTAMWTSFQILPMQLAVSLFFTNPAIAVALERVIFGKRANLTTIVGCICSMAGVCLINYPACEFVGWTRNGISGLYAAVEAAAASHQLGVVMSLVAALATAGGYCCMQAIGPEMPLVAIMWWYHTVSVIATAVYVAAAVPWVMPSWHQAGWIVCTAIAHFSGQLLLNHGLSMENASHGAALFAQQVLYAYVWHLTILHDSVQLCGVLGSAAILVGVLFVTESSGMSHRHATLERQRSQMQVLRRSASGRHTFAERLRSKHSRSRAPTAPVSEDGDTSSLEEQGQLATKPSEPEGMPV